MLENLKYYKGSRTTYEAVEGEIHKHGQYYTTCVIGVYSLTSGIKSFPCGIGDDYELKGEELVQVLEFIQKRERQSPPATRSRPTRTGRKAVSRHSRTTAIPEIPWTRLWWTTL